MEAIFVRQSACQSTNDGEQDRAHLERHDTVSDVPDMVWQMNAPCP